MKSQEYNLLRESFEQARQSTASEVDALMGKLKAEHPEVATRLMRMLELVEGQAARLQANWAGAEGEIGSAMIGPYKLLGRIGEGATGVVYLAQQSSPVHRLLAIKLLHPSAATEGNLRRFELEQQILATLDHAGIVTIVGSGVEERGLPYIVMPLVPGLPITEFCRQEELTVEARIKLFASTCRAVQHAHSHGVIHRDLKPGNILVSMVDGEPVSKIIDFGIAKVAEAGGADLTTGALPIGTLRYMCPEQLQCKPPTVQNDVYSLGAVFYEMLTEQAMHPMEDAGSTTVEGALKSTGEKIAAPSTQSRLKVAREIDWIVLKAVEAEAGRRYATVSELCEDVNRFVRGEAVLAGPPAGMYRAMRWMRKRLALLIGGAVVVAAIAISINIAASEHRSRVRAQAAADFNVALFRSLDPYEAQGRDRTLLVKMLDDTAGRLREVSDPVVLSDLIGTIGLAYSKIGESKKALPLLIQAEVLTRADLGSTARLETLVALIRVYCDEDQPELGLPLVDELQRFACQKPSEFRKCLEARLLGYRAQRAHPETFAAFVQELEAAVGANDLLTISTKRMYARAIFAEEPRKATAILAECRQRAIDRFGPTHPLVFEDISLEAWGIEKVETADKAIAFAKEWLPLTEQYLGTLHRTTILLRGNLANGYSRQGQHELADRESQRTIDDATLRGGVKSQVTEQMRRDRIVILQRAGRHTDAITLAMDLEHDHGDKSPETARILERVYRLAGDAANAERWRLEFAKRDQADVMGGK